MTCLEPEIQATQHSIFLRLYQVVCVSAEAQKCPQPMELYGNNNVADTNGGRGTNESCATLGISISKMLTMGH